MPSRGQNQYDWDAWGMPGQQVKGPKACYQHTGGRGDSYLGPAASRHRGKGVQLSGRRGSISDFRKASAVHLANTDLLEELVLFFLDVIMVWWL